MGASLGPFPNYHSVQDLLAAFYGGALITEPVESDATVGTTAVELGSDQPGVPISLIISNTGTVNVAISFLQSVTITTGVLLQQGGTLVIDWYYDGDLIGRPLYAIAAGAGATLHMIERFLAGA